MIQVNQQHLLKCEGDLDDVLNIINSCWLPVTDTCSADPLDIESFLSLKLPFISSNDWSCYSVLYFSIFAVWVLLFWVSFSVWKKLLGPWSSCLLPKNDPLGSHIFKTNQKLTFQLVHSCAIANTFVLANVIWRLILTSVTVFPCYCDHVVLWYIGSAFSWSFRSAVTFCNSSSFMPIFLSRVSKSLPLHKFKAFLTF